MKVWNWHGPVEAVWIHTHHFTDPFRPHTSSIAGKGVTMSRSRHNILCEYSLPPPLAQHNAHRSDDYLHDLHGVLALTVRSIGPKKCATVIEIESWLINSLVINIKFSKLLVNKGEVMWSNGWGGGCRSSARGLYHSEQDSRGAVDVEDGRTQLQKFSHSATACENKWRLCFSLERTDVESVSTTHSQEVYSASAFLVRRFVVAIIEPACTFTWKIVNPCFVIGKTLKKTTKNYNIFSRHLGFC